MPSPFPGMDPFIENQEWGDFHHAMIEEIRTALTPSVLPRYLVRVEESVYLVPVPEEGALSPRRERIVPDVFMVRGEGDAAPASGGVATMVAVEPVMLTLPSVVEQRQAYLTVRYRETRDVVTVIELLSPSNKQSGSPGQGLYLDKREKVLRSPAHLVELDMLRGGARLPMAQPLPPGDYYAFVSRAPHRPEVAVYAWLLSHPLPPIPIPLAPGDPDVLLDLQAAFATVYDRVAYAYALDYRQPAVPPFSDADASWVQERLQA